MNPCPRCGKEHHNPRTGFCWESGNRPKGFHCEFCCVQPKEEGE